MDQELAIEIMHDGHSVLLTGPAGSGKTYALNQFIRSSKRQGKHVSVTATTGLAATHLGGSTIHSWSGIGIYDELPSGFFGHMSKSRMDIIKKTEVLVIDEISMLHDYRLDMIDSVARRVREVDEPFGGLQVILCGDFFQLPPVSRGDQPPSKFVVSSNIWEEFDPVVCYLDEQHRQSDEEFLEILSAIRSGEVRRRHAEKLLSRKSNEMSGIGEITQLHTTNVDVDGINQRQLSQLDTAQHSYKMTTTGSKKYVANLKRSCLAQEELVLKNGALVMTIKNNQEKKYVNGSLGTVIDFEQDTNYPIVELKNGRKIVVSPETWELRDGDKKRASLTQLPLRLAWAITVHKSQGMTLDGAVVDLSRAFVEGMGYVALSRVKSLDALSLQGINNMALRVSSEALNIDQSLRAKSEKHAGKYEHLRTNVKRRKLEKPAKKATTWSDKIAKMREQYPNAYRPWTEADDAKLIDTFIDGKQKDIKKLTKQFGRHPGSIKARLIKHFGEEAVVSAK